MRINVNYSLKYSFNFKPKICQLKNAVNLVDNKIYCKNFIYFILFVECFFKKNCFNKYSMYIYKKSRAIQSILRAPNKHKKAQFHLKQERYFCILRFSLIHTLNFCSLSRVLFFIKNMHKILWFFESSLISLRMKRIRISVPLSHICEL